MLPDVALYFGEYWGCLNLVRHERVRTGLHAISFYKTGMPITSAVDAGNGNVGILQLDINADAVWAMLFTVEMR